MYLFIAGYTGVLIAVSAAPGGGAVAADRVRIATWAAMPWLVLALRAAVVFSAQA